MTCVECGVPVHHPRVRCRDCVKSWLAVWESETHEAVGAFVMRTDWVGNVRWASCRSRADARRLAALLNSRVLSRWRVEHVFKKDRRGAVAARKFGQA